MTIAGRDPAHGCGKLDVGACLANVEAFYECRADLTATNVPTEWQYGIKDGKVDPADIAYYDSQFALANLAVCDFTTGDITDPMNPLYGIPDGLLHPTADRAVFMQFWSASTPSCYP